MKKYYQIEYVWIGKIRIKECNSKKEVKQFIESHNFSEYKIFYIVKEEIKDLN